MFLSSLLSCRVWQRLVCCCISKHICPLYYFVSFYVWQIIFMQFCALLTPDPGDATAGSVATRLIGYGWNFYDRFKNSLARRLPVKEFLKMTGIWRSYRQACNGGFFDPQSAIGSIVWRRKKTIRAVFFLRHAVKMWNYAVGQRRTCWGIRLTGGCFTCSAGSRETDTGRTDRQTDSRPMTAGARQVADNEANDKLE